MLGDLTDDIFLGFAVEHCVTTGDQLAAFQDLCHVAPPALPVAVCGIRMFSTCHCIEKIPVQDTHNFADRHQEMPANCIRTYGFPGRTVWSRGDGSWRNGPFSGNRRDLRRRFIGRESEGIPKR